MILIGMIPILVASLYFIVYFGIKTIIHERSSKFLKKMSEEDVEIVKRKIESIREKLTNIETFPLKYKSKKKYIVYMRPLSFPCHDTTRLRIDKNGSTKAIFFTSDISDSYMRDGFEYKFKEIIDEIEDKILEWEYQKNVNDELKKCQEEVNEEFKTSSVMEILFEEEVTE
ncbi:MAG: hypothetical protein ACOC3V_00030 [bacterium]